MLQCADVQQWQNQPNYLVLVDTRDRPKQLTTYVAQENLEVLHRIVVSQSVACHSLCLCVTLTLIEACNVSWVVNSHCETSVSETIRKPPLIKA